MGVSESQRSRHRPAACPCGTPREGRGAVSVLSWQRPCVSEGSAAGSGRSWPWETGGRAAAGSARGGLAVRGPEGHCPRPGGREGNGRLPSPRRGLSSRARGQLADKVPEKTRGNREPLRGPRQGPWGAGPGRLEGGVTSAWQGAHTSRQPDQVQGGAALLPPPRSASGTPPPQPTRWGCSSPGGLAVLGCCCRSTPSVGSPQVSWGRGTGVERRLGRAVGAGVDQPHGRVPSAAGAGERPGRPPRRGSA